MTLSLEWLALSPKRLRGFLLVVVEHVRPHPLHHVAVVYLKLGEFAHYPFILECFLRFEFRYPVLGQKLYQVLINFYIVDDIFLDFESVNLV